MLASIPFSGLCRFALPTAKPEESCTTVGWSPLAPTIYAKARFPAAGEAKHSNLPLDSRHAAEDPARLEMERHLLDLARRAVRKSR